MRFTFVALWFILTFLFAHTVVAQLSGQPIEGEIMIQTLSEPAIKSLENDFQSCELLLAECLSKRWNIGLYKYNPTKISSETIFSELKKNPNVRLLQWNHKIELRESEETTPDDPYFPQQWNMNNTGVGGGVAGADIDALRAWNLCTGGISISGDTLVVAVIDGGSCLTHVDLNLFKNRNEIPNNQIDDDLNGYIDDYDGWNAYTNTGTIPDHAHGTHVTGIAAARGNNALGVCGINWNVKVLPVAGSSTLESTVIKAYAYVYEMRRQYELTNGQKGAFIVATNSSFGVNNGQPENYPIWGAMYDSLGTLGILNVAATANANVDVDLVGDIPTAFESPWLIGVTNTTSQDTRFGSAAYGARSIDLGAPGTQILSTKLNNTYDLSTGTSMASPHVAGAVALMLSGADQTFLEAYSESPAETMLTLKTWILQGTDPLNDLEGKTVSGGRLNLYQSLLLLQQDVVVEIQEDSLLFLLPILMQGTKSIHLHNAGSKTNTFHLAISENVPWLHSEVDSVTLSPGEEVEVDLGFSGIETAGIYSTTVQIIFNGIIVASLPVKANIFESAMVLSGEGLTWLMPVQMDFDTLFSISHTMPVTESLQIGALFPASWLAISPETADLDNGDTLLVNLHFNTTSLDTGTYTQTVRIQSLYAGTLVFSVRLQVYNPDGLSEHNRTLQLSVSPNPFTDQLTLAYTFESATPAEFELRSMTGSLLLRKELTDTYQAEDKIEVKAVKPGVYQYLLRNHNQVLATGKIVKW